MEKKSVLITGSGSGLGKIVAIRLAERGHKVIATTLYEEEANNLREIAKDKNLNLIAFKLDIRQKEERDKIHDYDFNVLINNAAIGDSGSICEIPIDNFKKVYETNVFSTILITQDAFKKFIEKGRGRVIFISSLAGRVSIPFLSPYSSSKAAISSFAEALQFEVKLIKEAKIDITIIEPGTFATGFNKENNEKMYEWMNKYTYFNENLDKIKKIKDKLWKMIEIKNFDIILKKYVKAVEDRKVKKKYHAPFFQYLCIKLIEIFK